MMMKVNIDGMRALRGFFLGEGVGWLVDQRGFREVLGVMKALPLKGTHYIRI